MISAMQTSHLIGLKDAPVQHSNGSHAKVFVTDDLMKRRTLAYQARQLKMPNEQVKHGPMTQILWLRTSSGG